MEGDLTIVVRDATGLPLPAQVELVSRVSLFRADAHCDAEGRARFKRIPLGVYRLQVSHQDFQAYSEQLRVPTELPVTRQITLDVADIETSLTILDSAPLLDRDQAGTIFRVGRGQLRENAFTTLGRSTINLVDSLPGWLLEANAVLHPRGSEYDTQYVIDGIPLLDNRSLAFAPGFETDEFEALNVITATIPAEFGRKLGGVVELYTLPLGSTRPLSGIQPSGGKFQQHARGVFRPVRPRQDKCCFGAACRPHRTIPGPAVSRELHEHSELSRLQRSVRARLKRPRPGGPLPAFESSQLHGSE